MTMLSKKKKNRRKTWNTFEPMIKKLNTNTENNPMQEKKLES